MVQAAVHLTNLAIANPAGGPASTGEVDLTAHTANGSLLANLNARLNGASLVLQGETKLSGDYATQAKLTLANLDINPYLGLFSVNGVKGTSNINGTITVNGPLTKLQQLSGTAELSKIAVMSQGATVSTDGPLKASLEHGVATLAPLHITGPGTDLTAQGKAALFGTSRSLETRRLSVRSILKLHTPLIPTSRARVW